MTDAAGLTVAAWVALAAGALLVGFAKTAVGGVASISVALFAAVLPAKESTGTLLPLLMVGDVVAVWAYRRHADWPTLLRLMPSVAVGVLIGTVFVARVDDTVMRRTIGAVLMVLLAVHLVTRRRSRAEPEAEEAVDVQATRAAVIGGHALSAGYGSLAGFTTMVANAGGPVMSLYLLAAGFAMLGFLGTTAWFFALVNLFKVPFSVGLGLITLDSLRMDLLLVPAVLVGALAGRLVVHRLNDRVFAWIVVVVTFLSALNLLR